MAQRDERRREGRPGYELVEWTMAIAVLAAWIGLALAPTFAAFEDAGRARVRDNLASLGRAALDFAAAHGGAPPAQLSDLADFVPPALADLVADGADAGIFYSLEADPGDPSGRRVIVTSAPAVAGITGDLVCSIDADLVIGCEPAGSGSSATAPGVVAGL
jgi:hypothetical protein